MGLGGAESPLTNRLQKFYDSAINKNYISYENISLIKLFDYNNVAGKIDFLINPRQEKIFNFLTSLNYVAWVEQNQDVSWYVYNDITNSIRLFEVDYDGKNVNALLPGNYDQDKNFVNAVKYPFTKFFTVAKILVPEGIERVTLRYGPNIQTGIEGVDLYAWYDLFNFSVKHEKIPLQAYNLDSKKIFGY